MARSEGFTLLELLVVLVVLSTLAVLAFGYEREALARMEVESAARRVLLGIERGRLAAERQGRPCALSLEARGWRGPVSGSLPACEAVPLELGEGVGAIGEVRLQHNLPAAVRFTSNGLLIDAGSVQVSHPATALVRCVVVSLPLGITRVGLQNEAGCMPDPSL